MSDSLFFRHYAADPYFNMAFDEWMLGCALESPGAMLLRLYTWRVGTITFGVNQRKDTALDFSKAGDTPVIRRVTGGRAVYHDVSELTYSIAVNPFSHDRENLAGSVSATYRVIAEALRGFLSELGLESELVGRSSPENALPDVFHKAPCFESVARNELVSGGEKIIASAQRQVKGVILQHGSIKLTGLAGHPALNGIGAFDATPPQTLAEERFDALAARFPGAVGRELGVTLAVAEVSGDCAKAVDRLTQVVQENPLSRRDIVKQTTLPNGL